MIDFEPSDRWANDLQPAPNELQLAIILLSQSAAVDAAAEAAVAAAGTGGTAEEHAADGLGGSGGDDMDTVRGDCDVRVGGAASDCETPAAAGACGGGQPRQQRLSETLAYAGAPPNHHASHQVIDNSLTKFGDAKKEIVAEVYKRMCYDNPKVLAIPRIHLRPSSSQ